MAKRKKRRAAKSKYCVYTGKKAPRKVSCHRLKSDAVKAAKRLRKKGTVGKRPRNVRVRKAATTKRRKRRK